MSKENIAVWGERIAAHHADTFQVGENVFFNRSGVGPYVVVSIYDIPEVDEWGGHPREGVGHHQHVTLCFDDRDRTGVSKHIFSGAWLAKDRDVAISRGRQS